MYLCDHDTVSEYSWFGCLLLPQSLTEPDDHINLLLHEHAAAWVLKSPYWDQSIVLLFGGCNKRGKVRLNLMDIQIIDWPCNCGYIVDVSRGYAEHQRVAGIPLYQCGHSCFTGYLTVVVAYRRERKVDIVRQTCGVNQHSWVGANIIFYPIDVRIKEALNIIPLSDWARPCLKNKSCTTNRCAIL